MCCKVVSFYAVKGRRYGRCEDIKQYYKGYNAHVDFLPVRLLFTRFLIALLNHHTNLIVDFLGK